MQVPFSKMHGLGNDFVIFDAVSRPLSLTAAQARWIADRHFGVGCDQILLAEPPRSAGADFTYRILNADGSEAGQCGNGARCLARFVHEQRLTDKTDIVVDIPDGQMRIQTLTAGQFRAEMGVPKFTPADIPFMAQEVAASYSLDVEGEVVNMQALAIGNPHAVITVDSVDTAPVNRLGAAVERHPRFPERVNVGFMQLVDNGNLRLRVYERGAGETLACGSGACAAAIAGRRGHGMREHIRVSLPGGILEVEWSGEGSPVYLTGPAEQVFSGTLDLADVPPGDNC